MTDSLSNAFGEEFVQKFQSERQKRIAERQRIDDEEMARICARAINDGEMEGGEPMFTYRTDSGITHTVMLVTVPDPESRTYWSLKTEGQNGSFSLPLDYLGDWIWSWFNEEQKDLAKRLEPGEHFIVVGNLSSWERDDGSEQDNFSPIRGVISVQEARQYAQKVLEDEGFDTSSEPEPEPESEPQQETEEESEEEDDVTPPWAQENDEEEDVDEDITEDTDSDNDGGLGGLLDEDEEEEDEQEVEDDSTSQFEYDEVRTVVEDLAQQDDRVWQVDPDEQLGLVNKVVNMVGNRLDLEIDNEGQVADDDAAEELAGLVVRAIDEGPEENDEDEEDMLF